ncbi:hypothetical protein SUGI_1026170 [Cryptomeria japonica]|nr:hypothetical protein SUGI_1026170 [Cryptomeria japonica]
MEEESSGIDINATQSLSSKAVEERLIGKSFRDAIVGDIMQVPLEAKFNLTSTEDPRGNGDYPPSYLVIASLDSTPMKPNSLIDDDNVFYEAIPAAPMVDNSKPTCPSKIGLSEGDTPEEASSVDIHESEVEIEVRSNFSVISGEGMKDSDNLNEEISKAEALTRRKRVQRIIEGCHCKLCSQQVSYRYAFYMLSAFLFHTILFH